MCHEALTKNTMIFCADQSASVHVTNKCVLMISRILFDLRLVHAARWLVQIADFRICNLRLRLWASPAQLVQRP